MLEFSISNQLLTRLDATAVYSDSENYLECGFSFSEDWEGLTPVAVFGHADVAEPIAVPIVEGVCRVPHEVIHPYAFALAVYGTGADGQGGTFTHVPTNVTAVEVGEAGTAKGLGVPEPTQDLYDSLMAAIQESTQAAGESKVAAQAAAGQAEGAAQASDAAKVQAEGYAQEARQAASDAEVSAQSALRGATAVERAVQAAQKDMVDVDALRREMEDTLLLHKSYAMGTGEYAVVAALRDIQWVGGKASGPYLDLAPQRRYLVEVNGVRYDGISRLTAVNVPLDEERAATTYAATDNDEQFEPDPGDPGGEAEFGDPIYKYHTQVTLVAGPVTLVDSRTGCGTVESECFLTTQDSSVSEVVIVTDGQDNGKHYMEEAKAARDEAQAAQTAAQGAAAQAASDRSAAQTARTAAQNAAAQAKEASRPPYVGENGHWYVWDEGTGAFGDSGVNAQGPAGVDGAENALPLAGPSDVLDTVADVDELAVWDQSDSGKVKKAAWGKLKEVLSGLFAAKSHGHSLASLNAASAYHTHTAADVGALAKSGGDLTGTLYMNNKVITGLGTPLAPTDAVNLETVFALLSGTSFEVPYVATVNGYPDYQKTGYVKAIRENSPSANGFRFTFIGARFDPTPDAGVSVPSNSTVYFDLRVAGYNQVGDWSADGKGRMRVTGGGTFYSVTNQGSDTIIRLIVPLGRVTIMSGYLTLGVV